MNLYNFLYRLVVCCQMQLVYHNNRSHPPPPPSSSSDITVTVSSSPSHLRTQSQSVPSLTPLPQSKIPGIASGGAAGLTRSPGLLKGLRWRPPCVVPCYPPCILLSGRLAGRLAGWLAGTGATPLEGDQVHRLLTLWCLELTSCPGWSGLR